MVSLQNIDLSQPLSAGHVLLSRASAELDEDSPPPPSSSSSSGSSLLGRLREVFAPSGSRRPPTPASPISSVSDGDDVLSWSAGRAVWTRGLEVVRTFSYDTVDISQCAFAWFDSREAPHLASGFQPALESSMRPDDARSSPPPTRFDFSTAASSAMPLDPLASVVTKRRAVCLFFNEHVEIFLSSGDRHNLHLPFGFGRAWPLTEGLLIERSSSATSGEGSPQYPFKRPDPPKSSQAKSSVFGLLELLGELSEVTHGGESVEVGGLPSRRLTLFGVSVRGACRSGDRVRHSRSVSCWTHSVTRAKIIFAVVVLMSARVDVSRPNLIAVLSPARDSLRADIPPDAASESVRRIVDSAAIISWSF